MRINYHESEGEKHMDNKQSTHLNYEVTKLSLRVWEKRNSLNLTVEQLAEKVGVTPRFITQIEAGTRIGSVPTLISLAIALNVTLGSLFE